jgi:Dyp-type peroxidase family protein
MTMPQPGIFAQGNPENTYLELDLDRPEALEEALRTLLRIPAAYTEGGTNMVVGVRPGLWRATRPADTPEDAADWDDPIRGTDGFAMPATPHDLWVWLSAGERSILFDRATELRDALAGIATVATELDGWHYKQSRDLTGFIDGSENPSLIEAPAVACVGPPPARGGGGGGGEYPGFSAVAAREVLAEPQRTRPRTRHRPHETRLRRASRRHQTGLLACCPDRGRR